MANRPIQTPARRLFPAGGEQAADGHHAQRDHRLGERQIHELHMQHDAGNGGHHEGHRHEGAEPHHSGDQAGGDDEAEMVEPDHRMGKA